ncbi:hypothetical protein [Nocardia nova]|uniref:hypothetical protein n=1 Tax=Nocardia nova TaxID=37330 RepID=UPI0011B0024D|nr:hypothetical protein [Nocardia nova]
MSEMSGWGLVASVVTVVGVAALAVAGVSCAWPDVGGDQRFGEAARPAVKAVVRPDILWFSLTHAARSSVPTVVEAHEDMQLHLECDPRLCAAKAVAMRTLVAAGRVRPDRSRRL